MALTCHSYAVTPFPIPGLSLETIAMFIMLDEILDDDGEEIFPIVDETGATVHVAKTFDGAFDWFCDHGGWEGMVSTNSSAMFEEMTGAKIEDERWARQLTGKFLDEPGPSNRHHRRAEERRRRRQVKRKPSRRG